MKGGVKLKDRYQLYEDSQDMLICELDKITQKGELTASSLDYLDKIVDIIKDLDEIMYNEDARIDGYSSRNGRYYNRGSSYRSSYDDMDYTRRNSSPRDNSRMTNGNSRGQSKDSMLNHLYMALNSASNEDERKRVQKMIDEIENN